MGGGLMELVATGAQDIYLTGNPQITFFKVVYRRHTNFSIETIKETCSGTARINEFENEASCKISRNGDLIHKIYLTVTDKTNTGITSGSQIIKEVELNIGGQLIDKYNQEWQDIWNELSIPKCKSTGFKSMTGNYGISCVNNTTHYTKGVENIHIPLLFWFCRNPGLSLPLIALQYHDVTIDFIFNSSDKIGLEQEESDINIYIDFIYLDTDERKRFAEVSHEYLIEQVQILETNNTKIQELNLNHPVKEIIWTSQHRDGITNSTYKNAKLVLNGQDRFSKQPEEYFQLRHPFDYHTKIPRQNLPGAGLNNQSSYSTISIFDSSDSGVSEITSLKRSQIGSSQGLVFDTALKKVPSGIADGKTVTSHLNHFNFNTVCNTTNNHFVYWPTYDILKDNNNPTSGSDAGFKGMLTDTKSLNRESLLRNIFMLNSLDFLYFKWSTQLIPVSNAGTYITDTTGGAPFPGRNSMLSYTNHTTDRPILNTTDKILYNHGQINSGGEAFDKFIYDSDGGNSYIKQLHESMVLVLPNTIANRMTEQIDYIFEVEVKYGNTKIPYEMHAKVIKIYNGNTLKADDDMTTFAPEGVVGVSNVTDPRSEVFSISSAGGTNSNRDGSETNKTSVPRHASGIVLGHGNDNSDEVSFIYLNNIIDPFINFGEERKHRRVCSYCNEGEFQGTPHDNGFATAKDDDLGYHGNIHTGKSLVSATTRTGTGTSVLIPADDVLRTATNIFPTGDGTDNDGANPPTSDERAEKHMFKSAFISENFDDGVGTIAEPTTPNLTIKKIYKLSSTSNILKSEAETSKMVKKINVYSFALKPEEHQPSGSCNFSRIDTAQLITDLEIGLDYNIYAVNYNVLRIMSGMGGLAYSN